MKPSKVSLEPHDPMWAKKFEKEVPILKAVFQQNLVNLHHIGSTAVPDIVAKPILDIMGVVKKLDEVTNVVSHLETLGFRYHGAMGIEGREYFTRSDNSVHLHIFQEGDPQIKRYLYFCEYLIVHPGKAKEYEAFKKQCAEKFPENSFRYADAKTEFIRSLDEEAARWKETTCE